MEFVVVIALGSKVDDNPGTVGVGVLKLHVWVTVIVLVTTALSWTTLGCRWNE